MLVGKEETEFILEIERLPKGAKVGSWMKVWLQEDKIINIILDEKETQAVKARIKNKMAKLKRKGSKFSKKED